MDVGSKDRKRRKRKKREQEFGVFDLKFWRLKF